MKIALCICGLTNNYIDSYPILKSKILDIFNPDIYMFGWEINENIIKDIIEKYNPKRFKFEPQRTFDTILNKFNVSKYEFDHRGSSIFKTLSYTYARSAVFNLVPDTYDMYILCRFDVYAWHGYPMKDLSVINIHEKLYSDFIYSYHWNQLNAGLAEQWFYCDYNNMKIICNLYKKLKFYLKENSDYFYNLMNGWPISNLNDEFSNEIQKDENDRCKNLLIANDYCVLNHHYLYKYHLWKNNLLQKCRFI